MEIDEHERYLIERIEGIKREYEARIEPYVQTLIKLRSLRPLPPMIVSDPTVAASLVDNYFTSPLDKSKSNL